MTIPLPVCQNVPFQFETNHVVFHFLGERMELLNKNGLLSGISYGRRVNSRPACLQVKIAKKSYRKGFYQSYSLEGLVDFYDQYGRAVVDVLTYWGVDDVEVTAMALAAADRFLEHWCLAIREVTVTVKVVVEI